MIDRFAIVVTLLGVAGAVAIGQQPAHTGDQAALQKEAQLPPPDIKLVEAGRQLFKKYDCLHCHAVAGFGGQMGPELVGVTDRRPADWIVQHFIKPDVLVPTTLMPAFGTEANAHELTAFLKTLRTNADAAPIVQSYLTGGEQLKSFPPARPDPASYPERRDVLLRFDAASAVTVVLLEEQRRVGGILALRREWYEPRKGQTGWRRYLDERVHLDGISLTLDSAHTVMDGVTHEVSRENEFMTLRAKRPGTRRAWSEKRRLPQPLYDSSDWIVPALGLKAGDAAAYWVFGPHGGAHPRFASAMAEDPGTTLIRLSTAGSPSPDRWIRIRDGRILSITVGSSPGAGVRTVSVDELAKQQWLDTLAADTRAGWVRGSDPSLLDTWMNSR